MGSFSVWHWLIVLLIVVLIFGTKKLKNIGTDLGGAVKGFKDGVRDGGTSGTTESSAAGPQASPQMTAATGPTARRTAADTVDVEAKTKS